MEKLVTGFLLIILAASCYCEEDGIEELYDILVEKLSKSNYLQEKFDHQEEEIKFLKKQQIQQRTENEILKQRQQQLEDTLRSQMEEKENLKKDHQELKEMLKNNKKKTETFLQQQQDQGTEIRQLITIINYLSSKSEKERNDWPNNKPIEYNKRLLLDDPSHLQFEIDNLKHTVATISAQKGGAVYIRWGKTTCPTNGTETVYSGYAGGSFYSHSGSAAEYVCLPQDPLFGKQIPVSGSNTGFMYGAEYETAYFGPSEDQDVPCVVCRSLTGTTALMIPARNQCYSGWKQEYFGHLASGEYDHTAASQYVCVDDQPEVIHGGTANNNGKLFYSVRSRCGSLPCPPYVNDKELFCVVCTR